MSDAFVFEASELATAFARDMSQFRDSGPEPGPGDTERLRDLFRYAHNLKGMSAMEAIDPLVALAHAAENLLERYRRGDGRPDAAETELLLAAADAMSAMVDAVAEGQAVAPVAALVTSLDAAAASPEPNPADPNRVDPSVDTAVTGGQASDPAAAITGAGHGIDVTLAESSSLPGARATVVVRHINRVGEVVSIEPSREAISAGSVRRFRVGFDLPAVGPADVPSVIDALLAALRGVPDVDDVELIDTETTDEEPGRDTPARASEPVVTAATAVRVDVERLDALMEVAGELVVARNNLEVHAQRLADRDLTSSARTLRRAIADMENLVQRVRMVSVEPVFARLSRLVRETARDLDKPVELVITGADTEVDRSVADEILQPLVHLLRNAIDHGLEPARVRLAAGKPEQGTIRLTADQRGGEVVFEVGDDGAGLDVEHITAKAVRVGLITDAQVGALDHLEILDLIFAAGFTTNEAVSEVSGRGVGLDVVRATVDRFGGSVEVDSEPGRGTTFRVRFPVSLAVMNALLVRIGDEWWGLPINRLTETFALAGHDVVVGDGPTGRVIIQRGQTLPLIDGPAQLSAVPPVSPAEVGGSFGVVIARVGRPYVLTVDELVGHAEIVVRPVPLRVGGLDHLSGVTVLTDGRVALVLDITRFIEEQKGQESATPADGGTMDATAGSRATGGSSPALERGWARPFDAGVRRSLPVLQFYLGPTVSIDDVRPAHPDELTGVLGDDPGAGVCFALGGAIDATLVFGIPASARLLGTLGATAANAGPALIELANMLGSQFVSALADEHALAVTLSPPLTAAEARSRPGHDATSAAEVWFATLVADGERLHIGCIWTSPTPTTGPDGPDQTRGADGR